MSLQVREGIIRLKRPQKTTTTKKHLKEPAQFSEEKKGRLMCPRMIGKKYGEGNKELPKHNTLSNMVEALL